MNIEIDGLKDKGSFLMTIELSGIIFVILVEQCPWENQFYYYFFTTTETKHIFVFNQ